MVSKKKAVRGIPPIQQQLAQEQMPTPQVLQMKTVMMMNNRRRLRRKKKRKKRTRRKNQAMKNQTRRSKKLEASQN
jgi:hypothetical protein